MLTTADEKMREEFEATGLDMCSTNEGNYGVWKRAWQAATAQSSARIKELEQQNEQLQAQVSFQLYRRLSWTHSLEKGIDRCRRFGDDGDAETLIDILNYLFSYATTQTAEAYKRRIQSEALEKAADGELMKHYFLIDYDGDATGTASDELRRMASDLK